MYILYISYLYIPYYFLPYFTLLGFQLPLQRKIVTAGTQLLPKGFKT